MAGTSGANNQEAVLAAIEALNQKFGAMETRIEENKAETDTKLRGLFYKLGKNNQGYLHSDDESSISRRSSSPNPRHKYDEDRGIKLDLPEYDGSYDPDTFLDWLRAIERIFDYKDYDDRKRCKLATIKLTKHASLWYENLKAKRRRDGKGKIESWIKLKKYLKERFLPHNYKQERFLKLAELNQGTSSVQGYIQDFMHNYLSCDLEEEEELKITRFFQGLNSSIKRKVELLPYITFNDVCKLALKVEKQRQYTQDSPHEYSLGFSNYKNPVYSRTKAKEEPIVTKDVSTTRQDKGKAIETSTMSKLRCFKCQGFGHYARECVLKRALTIDELEGMEMSFVLPIENEENTKDDDLQSVIEYPDESGECLLMSTTMSMGESHDQDTNPMTSEDEVEEEERPRYQQAPIHEEHLNLQQEESNLRANSFQEGEIDAGARGPKPKIRHGQQVKIKNSHLEGIKRNLEPTSVKIREPRNKAKELRYQDPP